MSLIDRQLSSSDMFGGDPSVLLRIDAEYSDDDSAVLTVNGVTGQQGTMHRSRTSASSQKTRYLFMLVPVRTTGDIAAAAAASSYAFIGPPVELVPGQ